MSLSPMAVQYLVMGFLGAVWQVVYRFVNTLPQDGTKPFHVNAHTRDKRKARFYYHSVWLGLGMAFLSLLCLQAFSTTLFESNTTRDWVVGITRGVGMWGLLIVAAVWSQVGQRVGQPNSDGASLLPVPNEAEAPRFDDYRRR